MLPLLGSSVLVLASNVLALVIVRALSHDPVMPLALNGVHPQRLVAAADEPRSRTQCGVIDIGMVSRAIDNGGAIAFGVDRVSPDRRDRLVDH